MKTKLSDNFWLNEFTKSNTAVRNGIQNVPTEVEIQRLVVLCDNVLQPLREDINKIVSVNSGFRCLKLNRKLKSGDDSDHVKGFAADVEINGMDNFELAEWIVRKYDYSQVILEFYSNDSGDDPNSGWIHVSYIPENLKREVLTIRKGETLLGLVK